MGAARKSLTQAIEKIAREVYLQKERERESRKDTKVKIVINESLVGKEQSN